MSESNPKLDSPRKPFHYTLLPVTVCILLIITCGGALHQAVVNNTWSLNYEHYTMGEPISLQVAPAQHVRARLWLARDALVLNDPMRALALVSAMANNGDAEALIILGGAYAAQGQFNAAVTAWSQARAYDSLISAAAEAKDAGRYDDALLALQATFSINSEKGASPLATFLLDLKNDPERAANLLQDVIQQYPDSVQQADWCYLMGRVNIKEKRYDEADNWFARAIALNPGSQQYWIIRANSARESGELIHALDLYTRAAKQFPDYASIYYEMAWAFHLAGSTTEAVQMIEKAIQLQSPENAWYEVRAGQLYIDNGRLDDALKAYQTAQSIDPSVGTAYLVSYYRYSLKDTGQAISALKQAIKNFPTITQRTSWMLQLASIYREDKLWPDAKTVYQQILAQDPVNMDALIGLGWVHYSAGDGFSAAQAEFQKAINAAPERGEGYFAIGQVLGREKRYSEADNWFTQAIQRNPDIFGWWLERGNVVRSSGDLDKAIQIYTQAIELFPNIASGYYELAWAYRLNNDKDRAVQTIECALVMLSAPSEWYHVRAGQIYEWVESKDQAVTAYREALKINPANSSALEGLTRLGQ